jgi:anti-anti-sigma regulatory factor
LPILLELVEDCRRSKSKLCLDFAALEYMNSSTFTPVVKCIHEARQAGVAIALEYSQAKKWQALSFSALRTFETADGRVAIVGR